MKREESNIQRGCVQWFRWQHPQYARLLFSVPNGGSRNPMEAVRLKAEGVVAGVSDLILMVPRRDAHALCIEMKTPKGRQSEAQRRWQEEAVSQGYRYELCRSLDEFRRLVDWYLS